MDQPKKVADRYLKQETLGQGTYGVVFKATDTKVIPHFKNLHKFVLILSKLGFRLSIPCLLGVLIAFGFEVSL